jgi:hypothetical protein
VLEVPEDLQAGRDDGVALAVGDVGDEADAAGVVLMCGIIEAVGVGHPLRPEAV